VLVETSNLLNSPVGNNDFTCNGISAGQLVFYLQ
jgi:hypothetical protein